MRLTPFLSAICGKTVWLCSIEALRLSNLSTFFVSNLMTLRLTIIAEWWPQRSNLQLEIAGEISWSVLNSLWKALRQRVPLKRSYLTQPEKEFTAILPFSMIVNASLKQLVDASCISVLVSSACYFRSLCDHSVAGKLCEFFVVWRLMLEGIWTYKQCFSFQLLIATC